MNPPLPNDPINAPNEDIPAAIPSLIDAAVVVFDADRDSSRRVIDKWTLNVRPLVCK
jgi:hypothetical protein